MWRREDCGQRFLYYIMFTDTGFKVFLNEHTYTPHTLHMQVSWIEFFVVGTYLLFLVGIGIAFKRLNSNVDDYFRSGCQGTWWLVGVSSFMAGAGSGTFV